MLESQKYTFWTLDTGELNPPQYPSDLDATSIPGTLRLTRLFPFGKAFLITPSFAISEPAKLCNFLKWFKSYAANPGHIMVTSHRFSHFLREIVEEKEIEQRAVICEYRNSKNVDSLLDRIGRSEQDIDDHYRAWELVQGIIAQFGGEDSS
jgi:chromo domain-containing protein 1